MNGVAISCLGLTSCVDVFRDHLGSFLGGLTFNLGTNTTFYVDLIGVMYVVECAHEKSWNNLWVETDSKLVILTCNSYSRVP